MRRAGVVMLVLAAVLLAAWWLSRRPPATLTTPVEQTEDERDFLSSSFRVLPRDAIRPIYQPQFVPPADARLRADDLVLGVEIQGRARAYPVAILNRREMVNDELDGVPILVTW